MKPSFIGDSHFGSTVSVATIDKRRFVKKTRSIKVDEVFYQFANWCKENGVPYPFTVPQVCVHGDDKLISWIEHKELHSKDDAVLYYLRAGSLLAICYMLGSTDLHDENLIANGSTPVIIDLETLLTPQVASFLHVKTPQKILDNSVLQTGLLPVIKMASNGVYQDISGFSGNSSGDHIETKNQPYDNHGEFVAQDYVNEICKGFSETYHWILQNRDLILTASPYRDFESCTVRCIIRQTQIYMKILNRLSQPDMQNNNDLYTAYLSKLANAFTKYATPDRLPELLHIYEAEAFAIQHGKIPYFTVLANTNDLYDGFGNLVCANYLAIPAFERSKQILCSMSKYDLQFQVELIRASFNAAYPSTIKLPPLPSVKNCQFSLLDAAKEIENEIMLLRSPNGNWIAQGNPTEGICGLKEINYGLYSGITGVALFEAALYAATNEDKYKEKAIAITNDLLEYLFDSHQAHTLEKMPLGWANGIGGICHALWIIAEYLSEPMYINAGTKLFTLLTSDWVNCDKDFDVLGGTAGLLLSMESFNVSDTIIQLVADHIIKHLSVFQNYMLIYHPGHEIQPLTGMGHGAAGIACALMVAWKKTGNTRYREIALSMLSYEDECYSLAANNWPDYRYSGNNQLHFMHGWCSGTPGIVLSRFKLKKIDSSLELSNYLDVAIAWSNQHITNTYDHLCCGNSAIIDMYLELGMYQKANILANQMLARSKQAKKYCLLSYQGNFVADVGLFSGLSGIGYEFLRIIQPDIIHTIL